MLACDVCVDVHTHSDPDLLFRRRRAAAREEAQQEPTSPTLEQAVADAPREGAKPSASKASKGTPVAQPPSDALPDSLPPSTRGRSRLAVASPPSYVLLPSALHFRAFTCSLLSIHSSFTRRCFHSLVCQHSYV